MALGVLQSADALALVAHVQLRLGQALAAAGFGVGTWAPCPSEADGTTLVVLEQALGLTDPLTGAAFKVFLRTSIKQARSGCMVLMKTEARDALSDRQVVEREGLLFLSWDVTDLAKMEDVFRKAFAALAAQPATRFADTDFDILAQNLTGALAP
jgi:hypothetical protein